MYSPISNEPPLAGVELVPGDVLRSEFGRMKRTVVSVEHDGVILRSTNGVTGVIPLDSIRRFWRKVGSAS